MRVLFSAYCMLNNENGDSLIGVYKRAIRIGLEMVRRGHEVWMLCTGRHQFEDDLTRQAERYFHFLDLPKALAFECSPKVKRRFCRMLFRRLKLDVVVAGEAPQGGEILECVLCAVSLGIRVVALDNAYSPYCAQTFVDFHGPMLDGMILTGLSSFHVSNPPRHYCAVPPYIEGSSARAESLINELGLGAKKLITVLAYERKAERLAASLLPALAKYDCAAIFLAPKPEETRHRVSSISPEVLKNIRVLPLPVEDLLFGLLKISNLVVGKIGFMQVTEALGLHTPFLGVEYRGCFSLSFLDLEARRFVYATSATRARRNTVKTAIQLLHTSREEIRQLHDGGLGATAAAADFLERLPAAQRAETTAECSRLGYPGAAFLKLLSKRHPGMPVSINTIRCTRVRDLKWGRIDSLVCSYSAGSERKSLFLWGRQYRSPAFAAQDLRFAGAPSSGRVVLFVSSDSSFILEEDTGERLLPDAPLGGVLVRDHGLLAVKKWLVSWLQRFRFIVYPVPRREQL